MFIIAEISNSYLAGSKAGTVKTGYWLHSQNMSSHHIGEYTSNYGLYAIFEQELLNLTDNKLNIWGKFGLAPRDCNIVRFFNGGGISLNNFTGNNDEDVLALGFGQAILCHEYKKMSPASRNETVVELTARKQIGILSVQPDFQYIFNPSGSRLIENPLCLILRTTLTI